MGKEQKVDPIFGLSIEDEEPNEEAPEAEDGPAAGPEEGQPPEAPDQGQADQGGPETQTQGQPAGPKPKPQQPAGQLIAGKFKSVDDLVKSYQELERKLGSRDEEKEQLRQHLATAQQILAQLGLLQPAQPQATNVIPFPMTAQAGVGQISLPAQGAKPPAPTQGQPEEEPESPEAEQQWLEQFYSKPRSALRDIIRKEFEHEFYRQGQALGQMLRPFVDFTQREMVVREYERRLSDLRQRHSDFDEVIQEFAAVLQEMPQLAALQSPASGQPDGLEVAYQLARVRKQQTAQATQPTTPGESKTSTSTEATKRAARMPSSTGSRPTETPKSVEDQIKEAIFGQANESQGVFD